MEMNIFEHFQQIGWGMWGVEKLSFVVVWIPKLTVLAMTCTIWVLDLTRMGVMGVVWMFMLVVGIRSIWVPSSSSRTAP